MMLKQKIRAALEKWDGAISDADYDRLAEFLEEELEIPRLVDVTEHLILGTDLKPLAVHSAPIRIEELPNNHRAIRIGPRDSSAHPYTELLLAPWQEAVWRSPQTTDQPEWSRGFNLGGDVDLMAITLKSFSRGG